MPIVQNGIWVARIFSLVWGTIKIITNKKKLTALRYSGVDTSILYRYFGSTRQKKCVQKVNAVFFFQTRPDSTCGNTKSHQTSKILQFHRHCCCLSYFRCCQPQRCCYTKKPPYAALWVLRKNSLRSPLLSHRRFCALRADP